MACTAAATKSRLFPLCCNSMINCGMCSWSNQSRPKSSPDPLHNSYRIDRPPGRSNGTRKLTERHHPWATRTVRKISAISVCAHYLQVIDAALLGTSVDCSSPRQITGYRGFKRLSPSSHIPVLAVPGVKLLQLRTVAEPFSPSRATQHQGKNFPQNLSC